MTDGFYRSSSETPVKFRPFVMPEELWASAFLGKNDLGSIFLPENRL